MSDHSSPRWPRRWPLALLALPAGVATWSGWVGLGEMTGFGPVKPLPGIADTFTINSAVTLPIGVEAYAAFALSAYLTGAPISDRTRRFAGWSAMAALVLGMFGQVAYHLLQVAHTDAVKAGKVAAKASAGAPWWITTLVSCLPVLVLGAGAALAHMLHRDRSAPVLDQVEPVTLVERGPAPDPLDPDPGPGGGHPVEPAPAPIGYSDPAVTLNPGRDPDPDPVTLSPLPPMPVPALTPTGQNDASEPGHDPDPDPVTSPSPATLLPALASGADQVRTALAVLGSGATPKEIVSWLSDQGVTVRIENVRTVLRRERAKMTHPDPVAPVLTLHKGSS